uniref:Uncharacterized protein n=1 Tax=Arion vulgaris TaxID=1028688 RepID=A0A0B7AGQ2_9EUPU
MVYLVHVYHKLHRLCISCPNITAHTHTVWQLCKEKQQTRVSVSTTRPLFSAAYIRNAQINISL